MLFLFFSPPELQVGTRHKELLDIDSSSVILEDGITKLNTIGHYEVGKDLAPTGSFLIPNPNWIRSSPGPHKLLLQDSHPFSGIIRRLLISGSEVFLSCSWSAHLPVPPLPELRFSRNPGTLHPAV